MKRADYVFVSLALAVVVFLIVLSKTSGKHPTPMPADATHQPSLDRAACLVCHSPDNRGAAKPIARNHPFKWKDEQFKCTNCHTSFR